QYYRPALVSYRSINYDVAERHITGGAGRGRPTAHEIKVDEPAQGLRRGGFKTSRTQRRQPHNRRCHGYASRGKPRPQFRFHDIPPFRPTAAAATSIRYGFNPSTETRLAFFGRMPRSIVNR